MSLPPVLRVGEVMERYGMKDERTARRLMNEAGAFNVGGRLIVREDDLGAWERSRVIREAGANPVSRPVRPPARRSPDVGQASPSNGPDWWRAIAG